MLRFLQIENFKSLKKVAIPIEKLNLFFGMNGMGKSSVIQSLLLLRQSYWTRDRKSLNSLTINGDLCALGTTTDILCTEAESEKIRFVACFDEAKRVDTIFSYSGNSLPSGAIKINNLKDAYIPFADQEALFGKGFCYLAADHVSPMAEYSAMNWDRDSINPLGVHGEYAVPFLALEGDRFRVPEELCLENGKTNRLFDQVSAWMGRISPGVRVSARYMPFEEKAKLDISYVGQKLESAPFLPVNVGFGVPYVLPLLVTLLTARKEGLILIENPESHLHPRGQSAIGSLIAKVANYGAQIICESHSDHLINGVRVAVKGGKLRSEDLSIIYFDQDKDRLTKIFEIRVDQNGNLSDYPTGLLDEWGIQMSALL